MDIQDYQKATGLIYVIERMLKSEVFTPEERNEMQKEAQLLRQAQREYNQKSQELENIIEDRVQERIARLNRTEPARIEQLEKQLSQQKNDMEYVCDAIKSFILENGMNIKDFELRYNIKISEDRTQKHTQER